MELTYGYIRQTLEESGFTYNKNLGQNFLTDLSICEKIVSLCGCEGALALEIGPGAGALTFHLARIARKVVAVEIDTRLKPVLEKTLAGEKNTEIVFADAQKLDFDKFISEKLNGDKIAVCANLPYYLTTEILLKLLSCKSAIKSITVMLQKEAAARLCIIPPHHESRAVNVIIQYYANAEPLFVVGAGCFYPSPRCGSRVIKLTPRRLPHQDCEQEKAFLTLVKTAFGQKRKTLANSLGALAGRGGSVRDIIAKAGINPDARPQELSCGEFINLSRCLQVHF